MFGHMYAYCFSGYTAFVVKQGSDKCNFNFIFIAFYYLYKIPYNAMPSLLPTNYLN
jgi:hypothetical protein